MPPRPTQCLLGSHFEHHVPTFHSKPVSSSHFSRKTRSMFPTLPQITVYVRNFLKPQGDSRPWELTLGDSSQLHIPMPLTPPGSCFLLQIPSKLLFFTSRSVSSSQLSSQNACLSWDFWFSRQNGKSCFHNIFAFPIRMVLSFSLLAIGPADLFPTAFREGLGVGASSIVTVPILPLNPFQPIRTEQWTSNPSVIHFSVFFSILPLNLFSSQPQPHPQRY